MHSLFIVLMFKYLFSLLLCFKPVIVIFFPCSFPPLLARLFCGKESLVMIYVSKVFLKINLNIFRKVKTLKYKVNTTKCKNFVGRHVDYVRTS